MATTISLYAPKNAGKNRIPDHFQNLFEWQGLGQALISKRKAFDIRRGLYPLKVPSAYRLSRALSASRGGSYVVYDHLDREGWAQVKERGGVLLLCLTIENLFQSPQISAGVLEGLEEAGLDAERVAILNNDMTSAAYHEAAWRAAGRDRAPKVLTMNSCYWMLQSCARSTPQTAPGLAARERLWTASRSRRRDRRFVSFNGRLRPFRSFLVLWLLANGWLDEGYVSLIDYGAEPAETAEKIRGWVKRYPEAGAALPFLPQLVERLPMTIDVDRGEAEDGEAYVNTLPWRSPAPEPFDESYFSIVADTLQSDDALFVTEKAFKCFMNFHPFVYFGNPGALAEMRRLGFQTFAPYIDESYDEESSSEARLQMAMNEVRRLMTMPKAQLHELYDALADRLAHNYRHIHRDGREEFLSEFNLNVLGRLGLEPIDLDVLKYAAE